MTAPMKVSEVIESVIAPTKRSSARRPSTAFATAGGEHTVRVALAGCGVVGSAFLHLLHRSAGQIASQHGVRFEVVRVLVRDPLLDRGVPVASSLFTSDLNSFLSTDADVVIEAIGGEDPASSIARSTLARGARLITANKQLVASVGAHLNDLADFTGGALDFEAAVGGGAPVVRTVRESLGCGRPISVRGILNGTSNCVLTLIERGRSYEEAIAIARRLGLCEADPCRDMDGRDAAAKLAILAWLTFGLDPATLHVRRRPLPTDPTRLIRHAAELGGRIRLIAECVTTEDGAVLASVEPVVVAADCAFGRTEFEENRVEVDLDWGRPLAVSGPGAGGRPTAASLLSDLLGERSALPALTNRRRERAEAHVAVEDSRPHAWLIVASATPELLGEVGRVVRTDGTPENVVQTSVLTAPISERELETALKRLALADANIAIARVEDLVGSNRSAVA
ncbi:MAG: homoserine dehydrogenase [Gemmatimonadaceae bacterium]|nr:homoserine dehydrogenase [Gemmatimonadaceae bacterium]